MARSRVRKRLVEATRGGSHVASTVVAVYECDWVGLREIRCGVPEQQSLCVVAVSAFAAASAPVQRPEFRERPMCLVRGMPESRVAFTRAEPDVKPTATSPWCDRNEGVAASRFARRARAEKVRPPRAYGSGRLSRMRASAATGAPPRNLSRLRAPRRLQTRVPRTRGRRRPARTGASGWS
jgi:hypothetical protein